MSEAIVTVDASKGTGATLTVRPDSEVIAENRVHAAAPDLLAACKALVGYYDQAGIGDCSEEDEAARDSGEMDDQFDGDETMNVRIARAAIAKATQDQGNG